MKKIITIISLIVIAILFYLSINYFFSSGNEYKDKDGIVYVSKVDSKSIYVYKNKQWKKEFIKGVNMGVGKPGYFPGEFGITKEEYLRWFKYIGEMNANTIRVYTILSPDFYDALLEYNESVKNPIYLLQGVWVNEEDISNIMDAHNPKIKDIFKSDIKRITDVIHGNAILPKNTGHASGSYKSDISEYVIAWVLGIEWDPDFVLKTIDNNEEKTTYEGQYLYTKGASPFEVFLCEVGDYAIDYETDTYKMQRPLSFTNWVTTDMLSHTNEPLDDEDKAVVNIEQIKVKEEFKPGLFASYHIYPYYPDFMSYQSDYAEYIDSEGEVNPYRAYLKDLIKEHTMPVLVAEFGIPASRGLAHENVHTGFNQGNVDENTQGEMVVSMMKDIYEEGYAGGLVFAWQDEWFKRTWNTMDLDLPERRPYWSNTQTNEQEFGLMAFDPGEEKSISYVDGDVSEWTEDTLISTSNEFNLFVKSDEKYVYFMIDAKNFDIENDTLLIPIDTIENQGSDRSLEYKVNFSRNADFLISIDGRDNSRILVDAYYDSFYYIYGKQLGMINSNKDYEVKNSGIYNKQYLCLNKEIYLPEDKVTIPFSKHETGLLKYGNGNPNSTDYNSLADFIMKDSKIEIRIPWQLLNVMDPSTKSIMEDFYKEGIKSKQVNSFYVEGILIKDGKIEGRVEPGEFTWEPWDIPTYHERLKASYFILKEAFKNIGG
ncbi:family 2 glycosyl transferase [Clostridium sp.]|uniref:family 2 glycosyl transferase n=1 Tax=Clostridium sp. TaxID=1506 RepID=UPI002FC635DC